MGKTARDESEWMTRKTRIDGKLRALGWDILAYTSAFQPAAAHAQAVAEYPTDTGPADYALFVGGRLLGIIEAKKLSLGPQNVLTQAQRYSEGATGNPLRYGKYRVPFLFSTNGEVVWFQDVRHSLERSRKVADYPTPAALEERLNRDFEADVAGLLAVPNDHPRLRPYQKDANAGIERAIADRKRQMLVAMATGCGKTFTTVNQIYRLMKSGVARRVLFLVDRRALAAQAVRAFAAFEPEPGLKFDRIYEVYSQRFRKDDLEDDGDGRAEPFDPRVLPNKYLTEPNAGHAFVYVCTIQRMAINLLGRQAAFEEGDDERDDEADRLDIPIHAFDCIVADECHRGYTSGELSTWREVLDYFDAIKIGLTATPAAHTTAYFTEVVYRYEYRRAVEEGFLVDYDAVAVRSDVRMSGLFLKEGEQVEVVDTDTGAKAFDLLEDERQFDTGEIERKATAPASNRLTIEELKKYASEHEAKYGRFPKTLIFAVNDLPHTSHADQLVELCTEIFGRGDGFVRKITGRTTDRPLQRIREFRNRPNPGIVVTVDMLSTGVDIPDLEFIVFLRPVKSRILFEQMLGRGTRRSENLPDKSHFTVFDCFDGTLLDYFRKASAFTREPPDKPTRTVEEIVNDIWANKDRVYNVGCLVKRMQRVDKEMAGDAREQFAAFIPDGDLAAFAANLRAAIASDFTGTMKLLRNESFQDLLVNYPRPRRGFVVAPEAADTVTSRWLIRDGTGREHQPADYLKLFAEYVRRNPDQIDAIRILFERPAEWGTDALGELRKKLATAREKFTEDNLRKAHAGAYNKPLADIISMVKHAADDSAPLLTAEERVDAALARLTAGKTLTPDGARWLARIREHLAANLTIDKDDFEFVPIFARDGGWPQANKAFGGALDAFLRDLNEAMAA